MKVPYALNEVWVMDTESDGFVKEATRVHCAVAINVGTKEKRRFTPDMMEELLEFLDSIKVLSMHNGIGHDNPLLKKLFNYEFKGLFIDTLVWSRMIDPDRARPMGMKGKAGPHSVEAWGYRFGRLKPEHEDWTTYSPEMLHRCEEDTEIQVRIFLELHSEVVEDNWWKASRLNHKLFTILQKQEEYRWKVDVAQLDKSLSFLQRWMDMIEVATLPSLPNVVEVLETKTKGVYGWRKKPFLVSGKLCGPVADYWGEQSHLVGGPHTRLTFRKVSLDKRDELVTLLLDLGWRPQAWNASKKTGERTTPKLTIKDPFDGVTSKLGQLIAKYVQFKQRRGIMEGWRERLDEEGTLPSIVTGIAATGRAKHSVIVNVPNEDTFFGKWMRKCFIAREGKVLVGCDAKSCQDRMLADRAKTKEFTDMLLNGDKSKGTDSHSLAAEGVNKVLRQHGITEITRGAGKGFNFAWKFGARDPKLGDMAGGNADLGAQIRTAMESVFPAQAELLARLTEEWNSTAETKKTKWGYRKENGTITGLDGRPIKISSEHMILVYMLQSDEAICMAGAYCLLYTRLMKKYEWGKQWAFVCWYHDEYTIECDEEIAEDIKMEAERAIGDAGNLFGLTHCPQVGEAAIGKNWYDIH